jgi:Flp pilus assembly protein TadD
VRASQDDVNNRQLDQALDTARRAGDIQPYAATASLQQALVLELNGDLDGAAVAARAATEDEPTNWQTWLVLSRIEAFRGDTDASVSAYQKARSLNPRSPIFAPR